MLAVAGDEIHFVQSFDGSVNLKVDLNINRFPRNPFAAPAHPACADWAFVRCDGVAGQDHLACCLTMRLLD